MTELKRLVIFSSLTAIYCRKKKEPYNFGQYLIIVHIFKETFLTQSTIMDDDQKEALIFATSKIDGPSKVGLLKSLSFAQLTLWTSR